MANYIIVLDGSGSSFNVGITGTDGTRQTLLGFATEAEAEAWIMEDKRLSRVHDRFDMSSPRPAAGD